jgi:hypothetical protein
MKKGWTLVTSVASPERFWFEYYKLRTKNSALPSIRFIAVVIALVRIIVTMMVFILSQALVQMIRIH